MKWGYPHTETSGEKWCRLLDGWRRRLVDVSVARYSNSNPVKKTFFFPSFFLSFFLLFFAGIFIIIIIITIPFGRPCAKVAERPSIPSRQSRPHWPHATNHGACGIICASTWKRKREREREIKLNAWRLITVRLGGLINSIKCKCHLFIQWGKKEED